MNAVAGLEHVNRIASPGHATLVLDTKEASVEMEHSITHVAQSLLSFYTSCLRVNHKCY